jgi:DNA-binding transcriptional LysR family regulator
MESDLNDISVFVHVVEARSFTGAGRQLGMPRSTVSRRIAQLERRLGARLLHRTTRSIQLTDVGASYYEQCARSLAEILEAEQLVRAAQITPRGRLRITAPVDLGADYLAPLVTEFLRRYPDVRIDIDLTQRVVDLVREGYDLALRAGVLPDSTLVARRLGGGGRLLVASPRYLARRAAPATPEDLRRHDCILANDGRPTPSWKLAREGDEVEIPVSGPVAVNDFAFACRAAVDGAGIAFIPEFMVGDLLARGLLVQVLPDWRSEPAGVYVVYPSAKHLSATVRSFRDFILAHGGLPAEGAPRSIRAAAE